MSKKRFKKLFNRYTNSNFFEQNIEKYHSIKQEYKDLVFDNNISPEELDLIYAYNASDELKDKMFNNNFLISVSQENNIKTNFYEGRVYIDTNCVDILKFFDAYRNIFSLTHITGFLYFLDFTIEDIKKLYIEIINNYDILNKFYCDSESKIFTFCIFEEEKLELMFDMLNCLKFIVDIYKSKQFLMRRFYSLLNIMDHKLLKRKLYNFTGYDLLTKYSYQDKTLTDLKNINIDDISFYQLKYLVRLLENINIKDPETLINDIINIYPGLDSNILKCRILNEDTLEKIGYEYCCTRENIRQIVSFYIKTYNESNIPDILLKSFKIYSGNLYYIDLNKEEDSLLNKKFFRQTYKKFFETHTYESVLFFDTKVLDKFKKLILSLPSEFDINIYNSLKNDLLELFNNDISQNDVSSLLDRYIYKYNYLFTTKKINNTFIVFSVLKKYFKNGISIYDTKELQSIKKFALSEFNYNLRIDEKRIQKIIQENGYLYDRGVWGIKIDFPINEDLVDKILNFLRSFKISVVPLSVVFNNFKDELQLINIQNRYMLSNLIKNIAPEYKMDRDYIYLKNREQNIYDEIYKYISKEGKFFTEKQLTNLFEGIDIINFNYLTENYPILNLDGIYYDLNNFNITPEEQSDLKEFINKLLEDGKIYNISRIYNTLIYKFDGLMKRIGLTNSSQMFNLIYKLYKNDFNYSKPFLCNKKTKILTGFDQINKYLDSQGKCTFATLKSFLLDQDINIHSYINLFFNNKDVFVVNRDTFATRKYLGINPSDFIDIDSTLDSFMDEDSQKALYSFIDFSTLPKLNMYWTTWILYSVIYRYSKKYKVVLSTNNLNDAIPVLCSKDYKEENIDFSRYIVYDYEDKPIEELFEEGNYIYNLEDDFEI